MGTEMKSVYDGRRNRKDFPTQKQIERAKEWFRKERKWFVSARKLARALDISNYTASFIINDCLELEPWSESRASRNRTRQPYIVPKKYREGES